MKNSSEIKKLKDVAERFMIIQHGIEAANKKRVGKTFEGLKSHSFHNPKHRLSAIDTAPL